MTAAQQIQDNRIVRGDGGARGVQDSGVTVDDSGNVLVPSGAEVGIGGSGGGFIFDAAGIQTRRTLTPLFDHGYGLGTVGFRWSRLMGGSLIETIRRISANATANDYDGVVIASGLTAQITLTMP
ncbi:MAG: hypothetical protein D6744_07385, partial [Planctomycetota bacterium]